MILELHTLRVWTDGDGVPAKKEFVENKPPKRQYPSVYNQQAAFDSWLCIA